MTIRYTHRFFRKPSNLIRKDISFNIRWLELRYSFLSYENGRRGFHEFMSKRIGFVLSRPTNAPKSKDLSVIQTIISLFHRNKKVDAYSRVESFDGVPGFSKTVRISGRKLTNKKDTTRKDRYVRIDDSTSRMLLSAREQQELDIILRSP